MTRRILVTLDGSEFAECVLPQAAALARATGSTLRLLRVVTPTETSQSAFWRATMPAYLREEWQEGALERVKVYLHDVAERLRAEGLAVEVETRFEDDAAQTIVAAADSSVQMIAMATHGLGGPGRWVLGSVAEKVLRSALTPLLLVRVPVNATPTAEVPTCRSVLVPLDGSELAEQALVLAAEVASACGARVVLVSVVATAIDEEQAAAVEAGVTGYLEDVAGALRAKGLAVTARHHAGDPAEQILAAAEDEQADLIVMGTHGRSGVQLLWLGSVATKVVQSSRHPVLLVRSRAGS